MKNLIVLLLFISPFVVAEDYPTCDIQISNIVAFTSDKARDKLVISVRGEPCYDGTLSIVITNEIGKVVYEYSSPFKQHNSVHWAEKDFDLVARKQVKRMVDGAMSNTSSLPDLPEVSLCEIPESDCETYERNTVPKDEYISYRAQKLPMLNHSTHYEGWASFIYDATKGETVKVLEGSL